MIDEKFLSEVLGEIVESVRINGSEINYTVSMGGYKYINIYELAHICKKKAEVYYYYLFSGKSKFDGYKCFNDNFLDHGGNPCTTNHKSEVKAIIEAYKLILKKNKKNKK